MMKRYLFAAGLVVSSALMLSGCASKSSSNYSKYGTGESESGGLGLGTLRRVHFGFDQHNLDPQAEQALKLNARKMQSNRNMKVLVTGHTDERGSVEYNIALGEKRARSVVNYLNDSGIQRTRLEYKSWGEEQPLDTGLNNEAYRYNRRAEFIILAK